MRLTTEFHIDEMVNGNFRIDAVVTNQRGEIVAVGSEYVAEKSDTRSVWFRAKAALDAYGKLPRWAWPTGDLGAMVRKVQDAIKANDDLDAISPRDDGREVVHID